MELERSLDEFREQGLGVVAISNDTPAVLKHFRDRIGGLSYPLIADEGSRIIRAFGILNHNIPEDHEWYGICFPGTYVVDAKGIVAAKYFEEGHRRRTTADSILVREFGVAGGTRIEIATDHLKLAAYPAQDRARRGNRLTLAVELTLPEKMHVYAPGVESYEPVAFELDENPVLMPHETDFPEPEILHLEAIGETVPVYAARARILKDVTISPRYREETLVLTGTFSYQACDDRICYIPTEVPLRFELTLEPHDGQRAPEELRAKGSTRER